MTTPRGSGASGEICTASQAQALMATMANYITPNDIVAALDARDHGDHSQMGRTRGESQDPPSMTLDDIRFNQTQDGYAIASTAGTSYNPAIDQVIARITPRGNLMGGVLFSYWTGMGGSINMHVAGFHPRWINRAMLFVSFDYPFNQLGVRKIFGQVPMDNSRRHHASTSISAFEKEAVITRRLSR